MKDLKIRMPDSGAGGAARKDALSERDPAIHLAILGEFHRLNDGVELIASENIVSQAVLEAQGSVMTNKYAEGYPGRRYYGGCGKVDIVERVSIERAKKLFGCNFANVQPHSGSQANQAVMMALLEPGDTIMGMSLASGGHLTHGARPNQSGKWFNAVQYGVREIDGQIDLLQQEKEEAVASQDFEKAARVRDQTDKLKTKKDQVTKEWREKSQEIDSIVDEEVIAEVVSKMTGIPLTRLSTEDSMRLMEMEKDF